MLQNPSLNGFLSSLKEDNNSYFPQNNCCHIIKPIVKNRPLQYLDRKNYQKVSRANLKLVCKGYKYISKVGAVGESSITMLEDLYQSKCLKMIRSLEFDPYFCEESGLKPLSKVLKKFNKTIQSKTLVIRRLNKKHEINILRPYLPRLRCLTKLRLEFPSTEGIVHRDIHNFSYSLQRCYLLKEVEYDIISLAKINQKSFRSMAIALHKLYKMEDLKYHVKACYSPQNEFEDIPNKLKKMLMLKSYKFKLSGKTGWTSMTDGAGQFLPYFLRSFPEALNPAKFAIQFERFPVSTEAINELSHMLPKLSSVREVLLEFSNCRLGELEIMLLANGFINCKQVEHLIFKFIETSPIPLEDILQFVTCMARLTSFPKLDLFFRKIFSSEWETEEAKNQLRMIGNVKYVLTKQSLYIYKRPE